MANKNKNLLDKRFFIVIIKTWSQKRKKIGTISNFDLCFWFARQIVYKIIIITG